MIEGDWPRQLRLTEVLLPDTFPVLHGHGRYFGHSYLATLGL